MDRSNRADVRNPILKLAAAEKIQKLPAPVRQVLRDLFMELRRDAQTKADECWRKHKAPMAVYWKACAVYSGHIARALR